MSTISIIVPVYNVEPYIHRCVDSILSQTFTDFELILVDDGSPDNCPTICEEYATRDQRVYVIHQDNRGLSAARNAGIDWAFENSDSEWLSFIDSDDWVSPQYLEFLLLPCIKEGYCLSVCDSVKTSVYTAEGLKPLPQIEYYSPEQFHCDMDYRATVAWGKIYKKDIFKTIRYPVGVLHEDKFVTYKLLFQYKKIAYINAKIYCYFCNQDGIMQSKWKPDRLVAFSALEQQIVFFETNGFPKAATHAKKEYVNKLNNTLQMIESEGDHYPKEKKIIKIKLRHALKHYKKEWNFKDHKWIYSVAWPGRMKCYWLLKSIKSKVYRSGK